jgi:ATP-dependent helicase HrpA
LPAHLTLRVGVVQNGEEIAWGVDLAELRRRCAGAGRAELDRHARAAYAALGDWRHFEADELPQKLPITLQQGTIWVYPTLAPRGQELEVRYEWSAEEAQHAWRDASARLARVMLGRQARDLGKSVAGNMQLMLGASPYLNSDDLIDLLLQGTFRNACFGDNDAPRTRAAFGSAVDRGRENLYPQLEKAIAIASSWFAEAANLRRVLGDSRVTLLQGSVEESREHLRRLLDAKVLRNATSDWLRQVPRYLKAELRRWQRNAVRGSEPAHIARELAAWTARHQDLARRLDAEMRWLPALDELRFWIEEYRLSLYAQEIKTVGPVSAARLEQRAAEIETWLQR